MISSHPYELLKLKIISKKSQGNQEISIYHEMNKENSNLQLKYCKSDIRAPHEIRENAFPLIRICFIHSTFTDIPFDDAN
jgi:hypothetical protein